MDRSMSRHGWVKEKVRRSRKIALYSEIASTAGGSSSCADSPTTWSSRSNASATGPSAPLPKQIAGFFPRATSLSMTICLIEDPGASYITSSNSDSYCTNEKKLYRSDSTSSTPPYKLIHNNARICRHTMMRRSPRAPVCFSMACLAMV